MNLETEFYNKENLHGLTCTRKYTCKPIYIFKDFVFLQYILFKVIRAYFVKGYEIR